MGIKTEYVPVAQLDRALDSDSKGQRFESSRVRHKSPENTVFSGLCFFAFCSTYGSTYFFYFCIFEPKMYRGFPREPYGLWDHTALLAHFSTFFLQSIGKDAILWNALDNALFKSLLLTVIGKQPSNNICYPICFQKSKSHAGYR